MADFNDFDGINDGNLDNYLSERDRFLNEFERALIAGQTHFDYDKYDWVMLADYAQDRSDSFLLNEAINLGLKYFPESPELMDRRLLSYAQSFTDEEKKSAFIAAYHRPNPTKLVRMYKCYYDWKDKLPDKVSDKLAYRAMCDVIFDGEKLQDSEIIEVIALLDDMNAIKFISKDLEKWEAEVHNCEMLWYELFYAVSERNDYHMAEKIVDKLISEFPYNRNYWIMKARTIMTKTINKGVANRQMLMKRVDEVLNIVDTVLAIEPEDEEALAIRKKTLEIREAVANDKDFAKNRRNDIKVLLSRKTEDPMPFASLLDLMENGSNKALNLVVDWIEYQVYLLEQKQTPEEQRNNELIASIEGMFMLDNAKIVDFMLATVDACATTDIRQLWPVRILMYLVHDEPLKATENLCRLDDPNGEDDLNPTKLLLSALIESHVKLYSDSIKIMEKFENAALAYRTSAENKSGNIFERINPCVTDFFTKHYLYTLPEE